MKIKELYALPEELSSKSAFVALVGRPNVGKSSILNALIGEKVAIVTAKPQTTRTRITGVLTRGGTQLVFIDTPGLHKPRTALSRYMVRQISESVVDVDLAVLVTEPDNRLSKADEELIENFRRLSLPAVAVINKVDTVRDKAELMPKMALLSERFALEHIIPVSALTGDGMELLCDVLMTYGHESPHFFPDDALTDQPERVLCAEMIREKLLMFMSEEIPHGVAVTIEQMKERPDGSMLDIQALIYCERENHKGMIIGKGGKMLKKIAAAARADMEDFLGVHVNLQCWVKVRDDWRNEERSLRNFGFQ